MTDLRIEPKKTRALRMSDRDWALVRAAAAQAGERPTTWLATRGAQVARRELAAGRSRQGR